MRTGLLGVGPLLERNLYYNSLTIRERDFYNTMVLLHIFFEYMKMVSFMIQWIFLMEYPSIPSPKHPSGEKELWGQR